jgi:predicted PurR-regulated permease PerM
MPIKTDINAPRTLTIAIIISLIVGFWLLAPFFAVIAFSAIAAFIFYPVYTWLYTKLRRKGAAAALTTLAAFLTIILPVFLVGYATFRELRTAANNLSAYAGSTDLQSVIEQVLQKINGTLAEVTNGNVQISIAQLQNIINEGLSRTSEMLISFITGSIGSVGSIITAAILFIYIFSALLMHHKPLLKMYRGLNPLGDKISNLYLQKAAAMTKAMVKGQFIIAAAQGLTSAALLYIAGVELFWLLAMVLTLLSIIPLGSGIITIPIGIIMLLAGNIWQGILVLAGHFLVITNIDNVLRPMLVPKEAKLDAALTLLSVFAGIHFFGLLGIVIGPVIMILIVTTFGVYLDQRPQKETKQVKA